MKATTKFILCFLVVLMLVIINIYQGSVAIPASEVSKILLGHSATVQAWEYIILENRLPQLITAILCGSGLAVAGLMLQTIFRNPLAGPSVLGIDSGANLGVALVMLLFGGGSVIIILAALLGAWLMISLLLYFSRKLNNAVMLLIVGMMMSYLASSLISLLNYGAAAEGIKSYLVWGLGSFSNVTTQHLLPFTLSMCIGLLLAFLLMKPLNALLLGENYAQNLGINVKHTRTLLLLSTGLITATSTAFCGPIAFIGLAVPHLARLFFGSSNHRILLPATALTGAALALLCNYFSTLPSKGLIPINVMTPILGVPVVIWVIMRKK